MNQRKRGWVGAVVVAAALGALLVAASTAYASQHAVRAQSASASPSASSSSSANPLPSLKPSSSPSLKPSSSASPTPHQVLGSHTTRSTTTALPKTAADPELVLMLFGGPPLAIGGLALRRALRRR